MEIEAVNHQSAAAGQVANLHRPDQQAQSPDQTPEGSEASEPAPAAYEPNLEQTSEDTDTSGVLRLLQQGHFKGVADVRLRINFFDELAAIEADQLQALAEEKVDGVLQAVGAVIGTLAEEGESDGEPTAEPTGESEGESTAELPAEVLELQEAFTDTVNRLKDEFLAAEVPSTAALTEGLRSAFEEFVASLQAALAPDTGDMTVQEAEPEDSGGETADVEAAAEQDGQAAEPTEPLESELDLEGFIADLRAAFETAMDALINAFGGVAVLGGLSEPSGNGVAYEKFLAIYNEMRGVAPADDGSQAVEPLEAEG